MKKCFIREDLTESQKESIRRSICKEAKYKHNSKQFCVFHSPTLDKIEEFNKEIETKLNNKDYDFDGFYFPADITFSSARFCESFSFMGATFDGEINFMGIFEEELDFRKSTFTKNSKLIFKYSSLLHGLDLRNVELLGYLRLEGGQSMSSENGKLFDVLQQVFDGDKTWLDLQNIFIEKPERVIFDTVRLEPSWFVGVDCKKFVFINCDWIYADGSEIDVFTEIDNVYMKNGVLFPTNPQKLFTIISRQLAENAENNNRFEEASNFRRMAFEAEWIEKKGKVLSWIENLDIENEKLKRRFSGSVDEYDEPNSPSTTLDILLKSGDFIVHALYRFTSFYGESWGWAAFILAIIIFVFFPFIYTQTEFQVSPKNIPLEVVVKDCKDVVEELKTVCKIENRGLNFWSEAIPHSLATASLQTVEYRVPKTPWGSIWMILEKIFAPLQAALLALAIRRKFMR